MKKKNFVEFEEIELKNNVESSDLKFFREEFQ